MRSEKKKHVSAWRSFIANENWRSWVRAYPCDNSANTFRMRIEKSDGEIIENGITKDTRRND